MVTDNSAKTLVATEPLLVACGPHEMPKRAAWDLLAVDALKPEIPKYMGTERSYLVQREQVALHYSLYSLLHFKP